MKIWALWPIFLNIGGITTQTTSQIATFYETAPLDGCQRCVFKYVFQFSAHKVPYIIGCVGGEHLFESVSKSRCDWSMHG